MPTKEEILKQLAEMQEAQNRLMAMLKEEESREQQNEPIALRVGTFFPNSNAVVSFSLSNESTKRTDIGPALRYFHSYRRNYQTHVVAVTEWEKLVESLTKLPNVTVEYTDPKAEKLIHDYIHSPGYTVEWRENYFKISISARLATRGNIFINIASAKFNHNHGHWEVAHSDAIPLWTTLEPYNNDTAWDKATLEFIEKALTQKSAADEVAAKRVSEKYAGAKFPIEQYTLKDYQTVSQEFADVVNDRMLLGDKMGLGKSPQAIFRAINKNWCTIFLPPAGLVENWRQQILKFTGVEPMIVQGMRPYEASTLLAVMQRKHKLIIIPYSTFGLSIEDANGNKIYPWAEFINLSIPDLVVLDEAHYLANTDSSRGAAAQRINPKRIWAMTGTPLKNKVKDMIVLGKIVRPDLFPSIERAVDAFTTNNGKHPRNLDKLQEMFKQFMLVRSQKDVYSPEEMHEKHYYQEFYTLTQDEKDKYNEIMAGVLRELDVLTGEIRENEIPNILVQFMRLKQLCSLAKVPDIVDLANRMADEVEDPVYTIGKNFPKIMIYSQFVETAKAIANDLGSRAVLVTGESHTPARRFEAVQEFHRRSDKMFYVCTTQAHQEGLDITGCGKHIVVDYMWTAMAHDQVEGRSFMRSNDPHGLDIYETIIPGSIEDHVRAIIENKRQLAAACVDGTEAARHKGSSIIQEVIARLRRDAFLK